MGLANAYAAVIREAEEGKDTSDFSKKLIAFMKNRGHLSLLPQVLRILAREKADLHTPVITVAKESDAKKFAKPIREILSQLGVQEVESTVIVDSRAVGGYAVRANSRLVDKTFRSALISLYQNVTN